MKKTLRELALLVKGEVCGDPDIVITGAKGIREAGIGDVAFLSNRRYASLLKETQASAVLVSLDVAEAACPLIRVKDPSAAFAQIISLFSPVEIHHPKGRHKSAVIAKTATLGKGVAVGACAVIEEGVVIGDNTVIYGGSYVGHDARIGKDCLVYANVSIRERVTLGDRVFVQSGAVIGSEGFGYVRVDGAHQLIPQVGTVILEDDVEIGANVTIDRARFGMTLIGRGTKIDNLVQIGHNVITGENCLIVASAAIAGSTHLGKNVTIAGQAGLVGHIYIGDGATCAGQAGVMSDVPEGTIVSGYPARPHAESKRVYAAMQRLPKLLREIADLKRKIKSLEER